MIELMAAAQSFAPFQVARDAQKAGRLFRGPLNGHDGISGVAWPLVPGGSFIAGGGCAGVLTPGGGDERGA